MALFSFNYGVMNPPSPLAVYSQATTTQEEIIVERGNNKQALKYAERFFKDTPVLLKITYCESHWRMWDLKGKKPVVLSGVKVPGDRGFGQINEHYHKESAMELGYDIENFYGNIGFVKYLYTKYGTQPWDASKDCWGVMTNSQLKYTLAEKLK